MLTKQKFTDPQGQTFTDAVVEVYQANYNSNKSVYINRDISSGEKETSENEHQYINCSFLYWVSPKTKKDGAAPYVLKSNDNGIEMDFNFEPEEVVEDLEKACEAYFTNILAPSLQS